MPCHAMPCHAMTLTCMAAVMKIHPRRFAEPCRLTILKLVYFYYHLGFQFSFTRPLLQHPNHSEGGGAWGGSGSSWVSRPAPISTKPRPRARGRFWAAGPSSQEAAAKKAPPSSRLGSSTIPLAVRFSPMASFRPASKVGVRPARCQSWRRPDPGGSRHQGD